MGLRESASDRVEGFLEPVGVRALGLRQRLKPIRDLAEAFLASLLGHARVHIGVLEVAVRVPRLTLGGGAEYRGDVVEAFDVSLRCEVQVATIRLRLTCECI